MKKPKPDKDGRCVCFAHNEDECQCGAWHKQIATTTKICNWTLVDVDSYYETQCNQTFCFIDDGIKENKFKYCPYCGGIIITPPEREEK